MAKTKFFRVAVEGDTVDGRKIERSWLTEAAATYNPETYAARVNMEHIRGITADKPFKAFGDVLALKTEEIELDLGGKKQKKTALFAEIEATDDLVAMNRDKQKLYTSIEIQENFANTGKAYMVGLAVTDSPASLGTEVLTFAVKHPGMLRNGPAPQTEGNVFSLGLETTFDLAAGETANPPAGTAAAMFAAATDFFKNFGKAPTSEPAVPPPPPPPPAPPAAGDAANDNEARFASIIEGIGKFTTAIEKMGEEVRADIGGLRRDHNALKASVEQTPDTTQRRNLSTGAGGDGAKRRAEC